MISTSAQARVVAGRPRGRGRGALETLDRFVKTENLVITTVLRPASSRDVRGDADGEHLVMIAEGG